MNIPSRARRPCPLRPPAATCLAKICGGFVRNPARGVRRELGAEEGREGGVLAAGGGDGEGVQGGGLEEADEGAQLGEGGVAREGDHLANAGQHGSALSGSEEVI